MVTEICRPYTKELRFECPIGWHESVRCRLECCDVAAAFVRRQRLAFKAVTEVCGGVDALFSRTLRDVALRAIGVTGASALRLFATARSIESDGGVDTLFSRTLRDVALRAIGLTGASALRLFATAHSIESDGVVWTRCSVGHCAMLPCGQLG